MDIFLEWQVDRGSVSKLRVTKECSQTVTMTSIIQSAVCPPLLTVIWFQADVSATERAQVTRKAARYG